MVTIPTVKPTKAQLITTVAGAAVAVLGYFAPHIIPSLPLVAQLGKLLWASGIFAAGAGAVQVVKAPS